MRNEPLNFIWGAGCSTLSQSRTSDPSDPVFREALLKYEHDTLLREIKRHYFERTSGFEDVHSCLVALNPHQRSRILNSRLNWADACVAELLRNGRAARVLTANFDNGLVKATAKFGMLLPLYRKDHPELRDAETPCVYLLGDAAPEVFARLVTPGANTGPWIVIGASGKHFGLSQTLLSIDRFEHGLYWVGHFSDEPPSHLGSRFFTSERNAHWISGFDADSFMVYLLRGLGEFPPRLQNEIRKPEHFLYELDNSSKEKVDHKKIFDEVERLKTGDSGEVRVFLESNANQADRAQRLGQHVPFGLILKNSSPRLALPARLSLS